MLIQFKRNAILASLVLVFSGCAQQTNIPPGAPVSAASYAPPPAGQSAYLSLPQLEALVSPIALYPDALLSQMLLASTYPLEVAEAANWLRLNAGLSVAARETAMQSENWSSSVKSLVAFPQAMNMLGNKLDWTQKLGDAYLAQPADLMQAVQSLRLRAKQAGNLQSSQQVAVTSDADANIIIAPANPQIVYVPTYNPTMVYGAWPYAAYPPYPAYDPMWGAMSFGVGMAVGAAFWATPNWGTGSIQVNNANFNNFNQHYGAGRGPTTPADIARQQNAANDWKNNATTQEKQDARQAGQRAQSTFQNNATSQERQQASQLRQQGQSDYQQDKANPNAMRESAQENAMRAQGRSDYNQDRFGGSGFDHGFSGGSRFGGGGFGGGFGGGRGGGGRR